MHDLILRTPDFDLLERPDQPLRHAISRAIPAWAWFDGVYAVAHFLRWHRRLPRWGGRRSFNDHLFGLKWDRVYDTELGRRLSDKVLAKDYVAERVGPLTPKTLAVLPDKAAVMGFDFPRPSVAKPRSSSGRTVVLRGPGSGVPRREIAAWLDESFYHRSRERQYLGLPQGILVEEVVDLEGDDPMEAKTYCFDGRPQFIQVVRGRFEGKTVSHYDPQWRPLPIKSRSDPHDGDRRPGCLPEMMEIAAALAAGLPMVRVDFYCDGARFLVGELTLNPANVNKVIRPPAAERIMGRLFEGSSIDDLRPELEAL